MIRQRLLHFRGTTMKTSLRIVLSGPLLAFAAATAAVPAAAGILWVDNPYESIAVPMLSPTRGYERAMTYLKANNAERAARAFERNLAHFPTHAASHAGLADAYERMGEHAAAVQESKLARRYDSAPDAATGWAATAD